MPCGQTSLLTLRCVPLISRFPHILNTQVVEVLPLLAFIRSFVPSITQYIKQQTQCFFLQAEQKTRTKDQTCHMLAIPLSGIGSGRAALFNSCCVLWLPFGASTRVVEGVLKGVDVVKGESKPVNLSRCVHL